MSTLEERFTMQEASPAEKSLKPLTHRDMSPKLISSNYPKFNERMENRAMEEVHRRLVRGEMRINRENS